MIALIAFALFVHYMVSPNLYEAFQEGAVAVKTTSSTKTMDDNITKAITGISRHFRAKDPKTKGMRHISEQVKDDVNALDANTFNAIVNKNGNIQLGSAEYKGVKNKVVGYIPSTNPDKKNTEFKDYTKIREASARSIENLLKALLEKRAYNQQVAANAALGGALAKLSTSDMTKTPSKSPTSTPSTKK